MPHHVAAPVHDAVLQRLAANGAGLIGGQFPGLGRRLLDRLSGSGPIGETN